MKHPRKSFSFLSKIRAFKVRYFWKRSFRRWVCFGLAIVTAWFCIELQRPPAFSALSSDWLVPTETVNLGGSTLTLPPAKTSLRSSLTLSDLALAISGTSPIAQENSQATQQALRQGQEFYQSGRFAEALATWESALPTLADPARQAVTLTLMALAQVELGQWPNAQTSLDRSQDLWPQLQDDRTQQFIQGKFWGAQGRLWLAQGQLVEAYQAYQAAEVAYNQAGMPGAISKVA